MTRINVIDPVVLTDAHLMAEYRELPMVMASLRRSLASKNGIKHIPPEYTLNRGHVSFFYDKGRFLYDRYQALKVELRARSYNISEARVADFFVFIENDLMGDWNPTETALVINAERVSTRIQQKVHWYRYRGTPLPSVPVDLRRELMHPSRLWRRPHEPFQSANAT